jgi:hypothetical protein
MQATDPTATKVIKHPSDDTAEFTIWIGMPRERRLQLNQELLNLQVPESDKQQLKPVHDFYDKITKECLRGFTGVNGADGMPLTMNGTLPEQVLKQFKEIRLPDCDNLSLWIGKQAYAENLLSDDDKKKFGFALITDSTKNTEEG